MDVSIRRCVLNLSLLAMLLIVMSGCAKSSTDTAGSQGLASESDVTLAGIVANLRLTSLAAPTTEATDLVILGEALFGDNALSGNRDISCVSCHSPSFGTGDGLPFSVGTGATGVGSARRQISGVSFATTRNSPPLFNLGRAEQVRAFADGHVSFVNRVPRSPVAAISGTNPTRRDITAVFTNVYDIQALFPLVSGIEMLGLDNNLAALTTETAVWDSILQNRLLSQSSYVNLFARAYPNVTTANLNPGHIGRAITAFMKTRFQSRRAPLDLYLEGDLLALSESQKRGMVLFYTTANCVRCHAGSNLTDGNFHSVGVPQIGLSPFVDDLGLASQTLAASDNYRFKTPSLRNLALTAPYMHNGAFPTIESVVDHYSNIGRSLDNYQIPTDYQAHYQTSLVIDTNATRNANRLSQVDNGALRRGLNLSAQEKSDLVDFLRVGLRDPSF